MEVIVSDGALIAPTQWRKSSDWNYTRISSSARGRDTSPQTEAARHRRAGAGSGRERDTRYREREERRRDQFKAPSIDVLRHDVTTARDQRRLALALLDIWRQLHADFSSLAVAGRIGRQVGQRIALRDIADHTGERVIHLLRLGADQFAASLFDEHFQAARPQTEMAQEAGRFAANALLNARADGLDQNSRNDRARFQHGFERILLRYP